jgi:hypothetical protein
MMIKDLYLQMISIMDFIYIHKTIRQVSTDPITKTVAGDNSGANIFIIKNYLNSIKGN